MRKTVSRWTHLLRFALVATALAGCAAAPSPAFAEHPHYLHALSDLRYARAFLNRPDELNVMRDQQRAIQKIDAAIAEIKRAAIDDRKPLDDHPPIDANINHRGRLHKAIELIDSAHRDLSFEEDDRRALGWRAAAIGHVDAAHGAVDHAINDKRWDNQMRE